MVKNDMFYCVVHHVTDSPMRIREDVQKRCSTASSTMSQIVANVLANSDLKSFVITSCSPVKIKLYHILKRVQVLLVAPQLHDGRGWHHYSCLRLASFPKQIQKELPFCVWFAIQCQSPHCAVLLISGGFPVLKAETLALGARESVIRYRQYT